MTAIPCIRPIPAPHRRPRGLRRAPSRPGRRRRCPLSGGPRDPRAAAADRAGVDHHLPARGRRRSAAGGVPAARGQGRPAGAGGGADPGQARRRGRGLPADCDQGRLGPGETRLRDHGGGGAVEPPGGSAGPGRREAGAGDLTASWGGNQIYTHDLVALLRATAAGCSRCGRAWATGKRTASTSACCRRGPASGCGRASSSATPASPAGVGPPRSTRPPPARCRRSAWRSRPVGRHSIFRDVLVLVTFTAAETFDLSVTFSESSQLHGDRGGGGPRRTSGRPSVSSRTAFVVKTARCGRPVGWRNR